LVEGQRRAHSAWTAQRVVDAFPDDFAPSYLLRDRDSIYSHAFWQRLKRMGIREVLTAPRSQPECCLDTTGYLQTPRVRFRVALDRHA